MNNAYRGSNNVSAKYYIVLLLIVIVLIAGLLWYMTLKDKNDTVKINNKVESIDGTVIDINMSDGFSSTPFVMGRGESAYEFTYSVEGETKVGWYKSGFTKEWILDYQEDK